jgi:sugar/nucleoside kinase (ribokinase family)
MYEITVIGHIVIDEIKRGNFQSRAIGGAATYSTLAAQSYGAKTLLISKIGTDFPENLILPLIEKGVDISCVKRVSSPTTKFKLIYENDTRILFLIDRCDPILPDDLCQKSFQAKFFHIGCVANEVPLSTIKTIRSKKKHISLDVQGYIRKTDERGKVFFTKWKDAKQFLKNIDIVHADIDEAKIITEAETPVEAAKTLINMGANIALITLGEKGSYIGTKNGNLFYVPAAKTSKNVDSTGAGDVYTVIFALEYFNTYDVKWAGAVASSAASFIVEFPGPQGFSNKNIIYERAKILLNHVKKIT